MDGYCTILHDIYFSFHASALNDTIQLHVVDSKAQKAGPWRWTRNSSEPIERISSCIFSTRKWQNLWQEAFQNETGERKDICLVPLWSEQKPGTK